MPTADAPLIPALQQFADSLPDDKARTHILVVDDSALDRQLLRDELTSEGYQVSTATDGKEGLAKVAETPPDLILLDVIMPDLTGYEVCRRLKSDAHTILIPVVMITSLQATEERIRGIEAGADDFLSKPFNLQELMTRVRSLLKLKRHTDELENAETVLFSLALSVEAKDPYTGGHCDRLARYSVTLGRELGMSAEYLKALHRGGILHDVGKIGIPDSILLKPGRLTPAERAVMQATLSSGNGSALPSNRSGLCSPSSATTTSGGTAAAIPTAWRARPSHSPPACSRSWTCSTPSPPSAPTSPPFRSKSPSP
jgi:putative two-component system response regulator